MFLVCAGDVTGDLRLNNQTKSALPKLFANELGNVFVPDVKKV